MVVTEVENDIIHWKTVTSSDLTTFKLFCPLLQGMVLHCLDNNTSAEKVLRDAVNADPTLNESW